jgi:hypothetical protein
MLFLVVIRLAPHVLRVAGAPLSLPPHRRAKAAK